MLHSSTVRMRLIATALFTAAVLLGACGRDGQTVTGDEDALDQSSQEDGFTADVPSTLEDTIGKDEEDPSEDVLEDLAQPDVDETCEEGETSCINGKLAVCAPPYGWLLENCPTGTTCEGGVCISTECEPLSRICTDDGIRICSPDGNGWSDPMPCPEGETCIDGSCLPQECEAGTTMCLEDTVAQCNEDGLSWTLTPCQQEEHCINGTCIECIKDADCEEGLFCVEGLCEPLPLSIVTTSLPDGRVGDIYEAQVAAEGGTLPYAYFVSFETPLPAGLSLDEETGLLTGTPEEEGAFSVVLQAQDADESLAEREFSFTVHPAALSILITTGSPLPTGEEGTAYSVQMKASGGTEPYFWGVTAGALPAGLTMSSSGLISGTPADHGTFTFTVKAFDNAEPVNTASKQFELTLKIAPLEIVGDQELDLWIIKVIVLPITTSVGGFSLPYNQQLQAIGGVKPYHWTEQELPSVVNYLISESGIPDGLTLSDSGALSGSISDPESAISVNIPFVNYSLTGFFFMARVEDSQDNPDSASALYLIPTIPISF